MTSLIHHIKPMLPCIAVHRHLLFSRLLIASTLISLLTACSPSSEPASNSASDENSETASAKANDAIVVYSSRNEHLIQPVFALFTEQTGIDVKYTTDKAGVLI